MLALPRNTKSGLFQRPHRIEMVDASDLGHGG
jgi:hypothetical protein